VVPRFDVVTVGGGIGGAALARVMAERGARVLVLEREQRFTDRVRGEVLMPWGVGEARRLGVDRILATTCARELRWNDMFFGGVCIVHRDLAATTPQAASWIAFYHPAMQDVLLEAAARAGAEVRRGARVRDVRPGDPPAVVVEQDGHAEEIHSRLVVGADGRGSRVRHAAGFAVREDPDRLIFTGVLFDDCRVADDTGRVFFNPDIGRISLFFPQGGGRVRAYVGYHKEADPPAAAERDLAWFTAESIRAGADPAWHAGARVAGPLATFHGADAWVEHPYREGVALVGDAAATSDPTWGQGMSLTLRDVRTLSDLLLAAEDWTAAGHAYAAEHDRYYATLHAIEGWYTDFFMEVGPEAAARRVRALPFIAADPTRIPDALFVGPDLPADDAARRRFFAEE
jgi:2-polyprenyl-6-methoxyphenol hydroxylase-like FAD-dependent oxidoreductase